MVRIWQIVIDDRAAKELRKFDQKTQADIVKFLKEKISILKDPRELGKPLKSHFKGLWRYRFRDYRIVCQIQDSQLVVLVIKFGHRRDVYKV